MPIQKTISYKYFYLEKVSDFAQNWHVTVFKYVCTLLNNEKLK